MKINPIEEDDEDIDNLFKYISWVRLTKNNG